MITIPTLFSPFPLPHSRACLPDRRRGRGESVFICSAMKHIRAKLHCNKYQIRDQNKLFWLKADCGLVTARHKPLSLRLLPIGCQQAIFYFLALVLGYIFGTFQSPQTAPWATNGLKEFSNESTLSITQARTNRLNDNCLANCGQRLNLLGVYLVIELRSKHFYLCATNFL